MVGRLGLGLEVPRRLVFFFFFGGGREWLGRVCVGGGGGVRALQASRVCVLRIMSARHGVASRRDGADRIVHGQAEKMNEIFFFPPHALFAYVLLRPRLSVGLCRVALGFARPRSRGVGDLVRPHGLGTLMPHGGFVSPLPLSSRAPRTMFRFRI